MKKIIFISAIFILALRCFAENLFGYWQIDFSGTKNPQTALLIYEYNNLVFGKVVAIYNEKGEIIDTPALKINKATGIANSPALCGLDIIWNLQKSGDKYTQGTVLNPDTGNTYNCSIWIDKATKQLVLRGNLLFFGQDKYLNKVDPNKLKPACIIKSPKPNIPQISFWSI
ncbi:MAG: DUF2147 domain-containing protein [Opitutales bacterium]